MLSPHPELRVYREEFSILQRKIYLNSCSCGPLSERVRETLTRDFLTTWDSYGGKAWYAPGGWLEVMEQVRAKFAHLIGAAPEEIALAPNVSTALSSVASTLDYRRRNKVVVADMDFPTLAYQWLAKERQGIECSFVESLDRMTLPPEAFAPVVDERTALVATSRVFFTSGYLQDIRAVADIAHKHGAYLLVDDYQGTGQIPLNVVALDIDVLVTGSLKWLMGGPGLAFLYVKKELLPSLHPSSVGWFGHQNQLQFDPLSFVEKSSAGRFEMGTPALAALYAAKVALEMIMEVGVERIQAHNAFLVNYLVERARSVGLRVRVPEVPEQRSAIVLFEVENPATAEEKLQAQNFVLDARAGSLRVAPHFFNLTDEMDRFVETLSRTQRGYKHFSY